MSYGKSVGEENKAFGQVEKGSETKREKWSEIRKGGGKTLGPHPRPVEGVWKQKKHDEKEHCR